MDLCRKVYHKAFDAAALQTLGLNRRSWREQDSIIRHDCRLTRRKNVSQSMLKNIKAVVTTIKTFWAASFIIFKLISNIGTGKKVER